MTKIKTCPTKNCAGQVSGISQSDTFCWKCGEKLLVKKAECSFCKYSLCGADCFCPGCGRPTK